MTTPPRIEVHHGDDSTIVVAPVPGARADSVSVDLQRASVVIHTDGGRHCVEVPLATPFDDRRVTMRFAEGVLWLYLPNAAP